LEAVMVELEVLKSSLTGKGLDDGRRDPAQGRRRGCRK